MSSGREGPPRPTGWPPSLTHYDSPSPGPLGMGTPRLTSDIGPSGPRAGFWRRVAAALVDAVLLGALNTMVRLRTTDRAALVASILIGMAYYGFFEGGPSGQTIGKKLAGIRVVRSADGQPLGWSIAWLRHLCSNLSGMAFGLGYLWMLWDRERQTWHDRLSSTVVVPAAAWPSPSGAPPSWVPPTRQGRPWLALGAALVGTAVIPVLLASLPDPGPPPPPRPERTANVFDPLPDELAPSSPLASFDNGAYVVGRDVKPGAYVADPSQDCSWDTVSLATDLVEQHGEGTTPQVVELELGTYIRSSNCGKWIRR